MSDLNPFSVYLVDDHKLFREGLGLLLGTLPYISKIYQASDGHEFLAGLNDHLPDLVFMDIDMPGINGIETTRKALEKHPGLRIVALSMYSDEDYTTRMINAGVKGFILKNSGLGEVENCMKAVMTGYTHFSPEILDNILKNINKKEKQPQHNELSERETEVLYRICQGFSNQEIADMLKISKRTVDKHRENLLLKTNSKNTAGLVMFAIRNGIVEV